MKVDLIKMLKEFFEKQGYDMEEYAGHLVVSDYDADLFSLPKSKFEDFLMDIYSLGHDAGYNKGLKDMRHIQAKIKEQENEKQEGDRTRIRVLPRSTDKAGEKCRDVQARNPGI